MPPAVQNLAVAPPAAAARKKPPPPVQEAPPRAPQFQRELARKRKVRREEPEIRQAERKETQKAKKPAVAKEPGEQAGPVEAVEAADAAETETPLPVEEASPAEGLVASNEDGTSAEADAEGGDAAEEKSEGTQALVAGIATVPAQADAAHVDSFEPSATDNPPVDAVAEAARARVEALTQRTDAPGAVELPDGMTGETASDFEVPSSMPRAVAARPEVQQSATSEVADTPAADEVEPVSVVTNTAPSPAPSFEIVASAAFAGATQALSDTSPVAQHAGQAAPGLPDATPPEVRFAEANHENIVRDMRAELLPRGGSMRIRLDPPQLGALQVTVRVQDGVVTAAFETSSDEATRLLGHSLNHLKSVLESHGVSVDKLQVQQSPREEQPAANRDHQHRRGHEGSQDPDREHASRQEQQRREMLRRMWRRLSGAQDPLDLTA
jgi:flagellar hook-length control protein FliK